MNEKDQVRMNQRIKNDSLKNHERNSPKNQVRMNPKGQEWFTNGSWTKFLKGSKNETKESRGQNPYPREIQAEICIQEGRT